MLREGTEKRRGDWCEGERQPLSPTVWAILQEKINKDNNQAFSWWRRCFLLHLNLIWLISLSVTNYVVKYSTSPQPSATFQFTKLSKKVKVELGKKTKFPSTKHSPLLCLATYQRSKDFSLLLKQSLVSLICIIPTLGPLRRRQMSRRRRANLASLIFPCLLSSAVAVWIIISLPLKKTN